MDTLVLTSLLGINGNIYVYQQKNERFLQGIWLIGNGIRAADNYGINSHWYNSG